MLPWPWSFFLILGVSFAGFVIGLFIGAELQRERLLRELRKQREHYGLDALGRPLQ